MSRKRMAKGEARRAPRLAVAVLFLSAMGLVGASAPARAQNEIVLENALPGNPPSEWEVSGAGDPSIQGFATDISVDQGGTIEFKVDTDAAAYRIDIYRLGWYGGNGARKVATVLPSVLLPQLQPTPLYDGATGLTDCGNWAVSASWAVPSTAVSGIYVARLVRTDTDGASHVVFIVRDDDGASDLLFQTSDATWQAYNTYGGNSLYVGAGLPYGHANKVSYNRPFVTRGGPLEDWVFNSEFPMVRWLERNGYDVSYSTNIDTERRGAEILEHKAFLSVGHDEYWSAGMRGAVTAARDAGVHLAFFSGNEIYWKTRYEPSTDGSATPYRTLVCYKEGTLGELACGNKCDPDPNVWTGLWRDGCAYSPPADGCSPENALTGQISWDGSTGTIEVPGTYAGHRFWRNSAVASLAPAATLALTPSSLGYEWDPDQYPGSYPAGRVRLSTTQFNGKTHHLSLDRAPSGALVFGAGTVQWSWGLDGTHDRGASTPSTAMQQATINLLADMGVQPETVMAGMVLATAVTDAVPPVTTIGFPLEGAALQGGVTITISGTSIEAAGVVAGVEVSTDGGTTWAVAQGGTAWTHVWTPGASGAVTILARAVDDMGNLEAPGTPGSPASAVNVTVLPPVAANCPCTIWPPDIAVGPDENDGGAVELGVKFRSDEAGAITGARFYKHPAATGTHVARLWTSTGTLLATATYTGESPSGWQQVAFGTPIAIDANTTYIISTHFPAGHYASSIGYFASSGYDRVPLHALASGIDGPNGVYKYGAGGVFPNETFSSSNYWVDLVFDNETGPDLTPPSVTAIVPGNGASGVAVGTTVTVTFNEAMNAATIDGASFELRTAGNALVPATVAYNAGTLTATLTPSAALEYSSSYTARVLTSVTDAAGNALAAVQAWTFNTSGPPPPPPSEGPGGPILVISTATNPFSRYPVEILRAEGFNAFTAMDLSLVTPAVLADYDVVLLGECALDAGQVTMLSDWTTAGGTFIAFRPDADLAPLLGLAPAAGTLSNAYLLVDTASGPGTGIVGQTIQFHGTADLYTLTGGATSLATLYGDASTATTHPAVTKRLVGSNGGSASAFTYDLARSVVYTRQGNPAWAGQNRETTDGVIRSNDLFYGNASGDPQTDWVNLDKAEIPQADEQQHLLSNLITLGSLHRKPMPRFWFLPSKHKAAVVMTGDDHGTGLAASFFDDFITQSGSNNTPLDVTNWTAVRGTSYMYPNTILANADSYQSQGFEVGVHVNTGCNVWTPASMQASYTSDLASFAASYPNINAPSTHRTHCIAWSDFSSQPSLEASLGIRLDVNYYYWPQAWLLDRPGLFTGSGLPMRFAEADGDLIDCFQVTTQFTDESGQTYPLHYQTLIDNALGAEGYYGVFCANFHTDRQSSRALAAGLIDYAQSKSPAVPVISARQLLTWLDGRNASTYSAISFSGTTLSFTASVGAGANNLHGMLPVNTAVGALSGISNGGPVAYTTETIKGIPYAFFPVTNGNYTASYAPDLTASVITDVVATPSSNGTATITWTTDEPATSRVDYGTDPGPLTLNSTSAALVTSHSMVLYGLALNTTYNFRVTSVDAAGNSASEPVSPNTLSFDMPNGLCAQDDLAADFSLGAPDANTLVVSDDGGAVILKPNTNEEFDGSVVPSGWTSAGFNPGATTVGGGSVTVNGTHLYSNGSYGPGTTLDFVATFNSAVFQNVGFSNDQAFDSAPWVTVGQGNTADGNLYARASNGTSISLGSLLGAPHRYRLKWNASDFEVYVDNATTPNATINLTVSTNMYVQISDVQNDDGTLSVDRMRITPYAAAGSYTSRVFNQGGPDGWGVASWTASVPGGTSLAVLARTGNTAVPDVTWTAFVPLTNGVAVGGGAQYLQYRADLATTVNTLTPALESMSVACGDGPDLTPPVISNVVATPAPDGLSATITWTTDEAANSLVEYGTVAGTLGQSVSGAALVLSHSLVLPNLVPGTAYFYRVTSVDQATNSSSSPIPPATLTFTAPVPAPPPCMLDDEAAEFALGTFANAHLSLVDDGVILLPRAASEFTTLPPTNEWASYPWTGGTSTVSGGVLSVDGARYNVNAATTFGPGSVLEFVATFRAADFQNIGFAAGTDATGPGGMFNDLSNNWAVFGVPNGGAGSLYVRTLIGGGSVTDVPLGAAYIGSPHRYRIEWNTSNVVFYVDGALVHTAAITLGGTMRPAISDYANGGEVLQVDWIRATPYLTPGTFTSRVHDQGALASWNTVTWSATVPTNTTLDLSVRTGNTALPDGSWTGFVPVTNGGSVGAISRYIQYQATLATTDLQVTPVLEELGIACTPPPPDATPPVISSVAASPGGNGTTATVTWNTDEPASSRVDYGISPGDLSLNSSSATLVSSHSLGLASLMPSTTYYYRVTSVDFSGNSATSPTPPATLSFVTEALPPSVCAQDQAAADFASGTLTNTMVTQVADGEVTLAPTLQEEFDGTSLPSGWQAAAWTDGTTPTVSGGVLTLDGGHAATSGTFGSGSSVEFVATFRGEVNQHIGLTASFDFNDPWALFSTMGSTNGLYARVNSPGGSTDNLIENSSNLIGSAHRYRIDWKATSFEFYVDGVLVSTIPRTISSNMVVHGSDLPGGALTLTLDWIRATPYLTPGTFVSRVHDGGAAVSWGAFNWTATTPVGTSLVMSARTGSTPVPDGTWSAYATIPSSGSPVGSTARYLQYRAELAASDPTLTPSLADVSVQCSACAGAATPIADLAATATGDAGGGRTNVRLDWSAVPSGQTVATYRKAWGDYPLYRGAPHGGAPAVPATPGAAVADGWTLTDVTAPSGLDAPPARGFWYHVAFVTGSCGVSGPSNLTAGTLDYVLGDFSDGETACAGDNVVDGADLSLLGAHYGEAIAGAADPIACMDVGPTVGYSTTGRPLPDGVLEFEDLVMCALNFNNGGMPLLVAGAGAGTDATVSDEFRLRVPELPAEGETFVVPVWAAAGGRIHALRLELAFDPAVVAFVGVESGPLLGAQSSRGILLSPRPGVIDVALLGGGSGLRGEGELVNVTFRRVAAGDPALALAQVDARDGANRRVEPGDRLPETEVGPLTTQLAPCRPNPFRGSVALSFTLAEAGPVDLALYSVDGRRLRTLVRGHQAAGQHALTWDGRDENGAQAPPGVYYLRLVSAAGRMMRAVTSLR